MSPIESSLRFLPQVLFGIVTNMCTGFFVHRVPTNVLVVIASALSSITPLLMALVNLQWSWWRSTFWAVLLGPIGMDGR